MFGIKQPQDRHLKKWKDNIKLHNNAQALTNTNDCSFIEIQWMYENIGTRAATMAFHPVSIGILLSSCIIHEIKLRWDLSKKQEPVAVVIPNHDGRAVCSFCRWLPCEISIYCNLKTNLFTKNTPTLRANLK